MLWWVYGWEKEEAMRTALRDAAEIAARHMRARDASNFLWQKALDFLVEHKASNANLYADLTTGEGQLKLIAKGTRTSASIVAVFNAGSKGDEIWYFPTVINKLLREKFAMDPSRIWEDLADQDKVQRGKDRIVLQRQKRNVLDAQPMYVASMASIFNSGEPVEETKVDMSQLDDYTPSEWPEMGWGDEG
jgi:hypothetical protein